MLQYQLEIEYQGITDRLVNHWLRSNVLGYSAKLAQLRLFDERWMSLSPSFVSHWDLPEGEIDSVSKSLSGDLFATLDDFIEDNQALSTWVLPCTLPQEVSFHKTPLEERAIEFAIDKLNDVVAYICIASAE